MHGSARCLFPSVFALLLLAAGPGCSRKFFRERADDDVTGIITQKNRFSSWAVKNWHVYPDPRARFADPFNPDRPPYPPDDYASRVLSPNPQHPHKKAGVGRLDGEGYLHLLEQWDSENRAGDPARGAPPEPVMPLPPTLPAGLQLPRPPQSLEPSGVVPAGGFDRPATGLRTAVGRDTPGTGVKPAAGMDRPASSRDKPAAFAPSSGEWMPAKPRFKLPVVDLPPGPRITEIRPPIVIQTSGVEECGPPLTAAGAVSPATPAKAEIPAGPAPVLPAIPTVPPGPGAPALPAVPGASAVSALPPGTPAVLPDIPVAKQPEPLPKPIETKQPLPEPRPVDPKLPKVAGPEPATPPPSGGLQAIFGSGEILDYLRALYSNQQGYRIKVDQAVDLGLINAREFQDRREDLYLAALPVSLERFNFATQAFFTESVMRRSLGMKLPGGGEFWNANTTAGLTKRLPTGTQVLAQLANQVIIDLGHDKPTVAFSNLSLSVLQPFLRGGGLAVNLESLTAAERNMVYAMRSYARFRKLFYVAVVAGSSSLGITNNPYGLQGLSVNLGRGIGGNLTAPVVGFLPLLQASAVIANQQKNLIFLIRLLQLYKAFREGGQQSDLQVGQVELSLLNGRSTLLGGTGGGGGGGGGVPSGIRGYLDGLDNFKLQLGLPMTVALDLDNTPLRPIHQQLARFEDVYADLRRLEDEARKFDPNQPVVQFRPRWRELLTHSDLMKGTVFSKNIGGRWDAWARLTEDQFNARMEQLRKDRQVLLDQRAARQARGVPEPEAEIRKVAAIESEMDLGLFEAAVRAYEAQPWLREKGPLRATLQAGAFRDAFNTFYQVALEGRNERLKITEGQWPSLPPLPVNGLNVLTAPLDDSYTAGLQAGLSNRLDLMNARGQVVDAYRQIAVQANSLQGVFNVQYNLNAATPAGGTQPFNFSGDRTSHQLVLNAELPLVRRAERNNYRAALVSYQRQRRTLMAFEDNIANDIRSDIRLMRTLGELYRIQQRVVELGYSQVDNAQALLIAPPAPGEQQNAGNAAALTQQVLQAQQGLVTSQNQLFQIWVSYLSTRMRLYLDLELMQLDDRGVWIDEQVTETDNAPRPAPVPPRGERLPAPQLVGPADRK